MQKILVTGGTGYIGSHTTVELINAGFDVIIIDNLSNSNKDMLWGIKEITGKEVGFEEFDLCDRGKLQDFFSRHQDISAMIHFAAFKAVGESIKKPLKYYRNNLNSLLNLMELAKENKISNLVFSSSATVYGDADELPLTENSPLKKANCPYGETKQICEDMIRALSKSDEDFCAIVLRYFNPVGAHKSALIGELPLGVPANLIPFVTQTGIGLREELKVFGGDYNTPDRTCVRDYIHIVDLAKAHVKSIQRMLENKKSGVEVFNLGTGKGNSVLEVIKSFERVSGQKLPYQIVERRNGDVETSFAGTELANKVLGWKAERNLDDAIRDAWEWEKALKEKREKLGML